MRGESSLGFAACERREKVVHSVRRGVSQVKEHRGLQVWVWVCRLRKREEASMNDPS